jgi:hypothetical protein
MEAEGQRGREVIYTKQEISRHPMEQTIEIPVEVRGSERVFAGQIQAWQYGVRFLIDVDGVEMKFERDDSGEFRAVLPEGFSGKMPDREVVAAIIGVLEGL